MARKTNYSFQKHEREKIRQKKRLDKKERKQDVKDRKAALKDEFGNIDPDIAGIEAGPQPTEESEE
jgi:hypothetical protein